MCERSEVLASACAAARAFPLYTRKSGNNGGKRNVTVEFLLVGNDAVLTDSDMSCIRDAAYGVRLAARITDTPCAEMNTDTFLEVGSPLMQGTASILGLFWGFSFPP